MRRRLRARWIEFALVGVAAVWGVTFPMVQRATSPAYADSYPLYSFLALRFAIAVAAFLVLFPRSVRGFRRGTLRVGLLAGAFLTLGYVFQTWGLAGTTSSKAAFITGMFVVFTPVLQFVVLRRMPHAYSIAGIGLALAGLWLLSGASVDGWTAGDTRVLLAALSYSAHMIVLGGSGRNHDVAALTLVQLATCALICAGVAVGFERPGLPASGQVWLALAVTGVLASAVAFAVQTYAQRHLSPTRTALILISEPAFGGLFGWLLAGDRLGVTGFAGAALILGGMVMAEALAALRPAGAEDAEFEPTLEGIPVPELSAEGGDEPG